MSTLLTTPPRPTAAARGVLALAPPGHTGQPALLLLPGRYQIGTDPSSQLRLEAPGIAPRHVLLLVTAEKIVVRAWDPRTWVNDGLVQEATLRRGDRLAIGPLTLRLRTATPDELMSQLPQPAVDSAPKGVATELSEGASEEPMPALEFGRIDVPALTVDPTEELRARERAIEARAYSLATRERELSARLEVLETTTAEIEASCTELQTQAAVLDRQQAEHEARERAIEARAYSLATRERALAEIEEQHQQSTHGAALGDDRLAEQDIRERAIEARAYALATRERELAAETERLEAQVAAKNDELLVLTQSFAERDAEHEARERAIEARAFSLATRERELGTQLESLEAQVAAKNDELLALTQSFAERDAEHEARERAIEARAFSLATREREVAAQLAEITTRQSQEASLEARLAAVVARETQLAEQLAQWEEKTQALEAAERDLHERRVAVDTAVQALAERETALQQWHSTLTAERSRLETLAAETRAHLAAEAEQHTRAWDAWEQARTRMTRDLTDRSAQLQAEVVQLTQDREEFQAQRTAWEADRAGWEEQHQSQQAEHDRWQAEVARSAEDQALRERDLKSREAALSLQLAILDERQSHIERAAQERANSQQELVNSRQQLQRERQLFAEQQAAWLAERELMTCELEERRRQLLRDESALARERQSLAIERWELADQTRPPVRPPVASEVIATEVVTADIPQLEPPAADDDVAAEAIVSTNDVIDVPTNSSQPDESLEPAACGDLAVVESSLDETTAHIDADPIEPVGLAALQLDQVDGVDSSESSLLAETVPEWTSAEPVLPETPTMSPVDGGWDDVSSQTSASLIESSVDDPPVVESTEGFPSVAENPDPEFARLDPVATSEQTEQVATAPAVVDWYPASMLASVEELEQAAFAESTRPMIAHEGLATRGFDDDWDVPTTSVDAISAEPFPQAVSTPESVSETFAANDALLVSEPSAATAFVVPETSLDQDVPSVPADHEADVTAAPSAEFSNHPILSDPFPMDPESVNLAPEPDAAERVAVPEAADLASNESLEAQYDLDYKPDFQNYSAWNLSNLSAPADHGGTTADPYATTAALPWQSDLGASTTVWQEPLDVEGRVDEELPEAEVEPQASLESVPAEPESGSLRSELARMFGLPEDFAKSVPVTSPDETDSDCANSEPGEPVIAAVETPTEVEAEEASGATNEPDADEAWRRQLAAVLHSQSVVTEAPPEPTPPPRQEAAPAPAPPPAVEEEDSIAAYMERMLKRNGMKQDHASSAAVEMPAPVSVPVPAAVEEEPAPQAQEAIETRPAVALPVPAPRRVQDKDDVRAKIDAFREVANHSARTALANHSWKALRGDVAVQGVLCGGASLAGVGYLSAPLWGNAIQWLPMMGCFVAAGWVGWQLNNTLQRLKQWNPSEMLLCSSEKPEEERLDTKASGDPTATTEPTPDESLPSSPVE